jgi:hypothetical protein
MIKITIADSTAAIASVNINGTVQEHPITWVEGHPQFVDAPAVGVLLGKGGTKVWRSSLRICKNDRYARHGTPEKARLYGCEEWVGVAYSPLNTINRDGVHVTIVAYWEEVPIAHRSKR